MCNVFYKNRDIFLVDFEHSEKNSAPFFDLGNILFSTIAQEWRDLNCPFTLSKFSKKMGYKYFLIKIIENYSLKTGHSKELL